MPQVKSGAAKKPAGKRRASKAAEAGPIARAKAFFEVYGAASAAGVAVILLVAAAVSWAGGYVGQAAEEANRAAARRLAEAGLRVDRVTLRGAHQIATDEIRAAVGPLVGASILHVSPNDIRERVEALGWVRVASVSRLLPDTIHVSIRERTPAAVWQIDGELRLIDAEGATIREVGAYEYSNLPFIVGAGAPDAASGILAALEADPDLQYKTYALQRVGERRWNMRFRNGVEARLPETGVAEAVRTLSVLQAAHGLLDQPLKYIDLRDPDRMVVCKRDEPCAP